ncbi:hypothetical protein DFH09DRAFT_1079210 [Mycena vulgaris]|nr:hypothetical protein DFH09DRAFT_1079210 [Mycena vulgaris]
MPRRNNRKGKRNKIKIGSTARRRTAPREGGREGGTRGEEDWLGLGVRVRVWDLEVGLGFWRSGGGGHGREEVFWLTNGRRERRGDDWRVEGEARAEREGTPNASTGREADDLEGGRISFVCLFVPSWYDRGELGVEFVLGKTWSARAAPTRFLIFGRGPGAIPDIQLFTGVPLMLRATRYTRTFASIASRERSAGAGAGARRARRGYRGSAVVVAVVGLAWRYWLHGVTDARWGTNAAREWEDGARTRERAGGSDLGLSAGGESTGVISGGKRARRVRIRSYAKGGGAGGEVDIELELVLNRTDEVRRAATFFLLEAGEEDSEVHRQPDRLVKEDRASKDTTAGNCALRLGCARSSRAAR